jgi:hypothetical protein
MEPVVAPHLFEDVHAAGTLALAALAVQVDQRMAGPLLIGPAIF